MVGRVVAFVPSSNVSGEAGGMNKDLTTMGTFLRHPFMDLFDMPVKIPVGMEYFAAVTEELFGWFDGSIVIVNAFVFAEIRVPFKTFAANIAHQWRFAGMNPNMFAKFVGRVEPFGAEGALVIALLKMAFSMVPKEDGLAKLFAAFQAFKWFVFVVTGHVFEQQLFFLKGTIASGANIFAPFVGENVFCV